MKLSIVIPVYNESKTVENIIQRVLRVSIPKEIIIVDDASTDGTIEILKKLDGTIDCEHTIFFHKHNQGKGAALRTGFGKATGNYVVVQDADLEYDPEEYHKLLKPMLDGRADVVYGSRFLGGEAHRVLFFWHYVGNKFLTLLSNMFTNLNLTDMETCYKMFRLDILKRITIEENRFGFEVEITSKVAKIGCRVYEVGISYSGRDYAEGKKIGWHDGIWAVWCIIKYGLSAHEKK
jgi:glycosyltransferase involved in cell wall biosynthesis